MWLFDKQGFISVVAYDPKKDRNKSSKFSSIARQSGTHVLLRSRVKADLDMIKEVVPSLHVEEDASADYAYRAVITRKQFKKFMARSVDRITYDSHFKEAARDASPKAEGRYDAMMSVWRAMSRLQDIAPWSGYSGKGYSGKGYSGSGYSSWGYSGSSNTKNTSTKTSTPTNPVFTPPGDVKKKTMEDWLSEYDPEKDYRGGKGPTSGFEPGDLVMSSGGEGIVTNVTPTKSGNELVTVSIEENGKTNTRNYLSSYLIPVFEDLEEVDGDTLVGLDDLYSWVLDRMDSYPTDSLAMLDDAAAEFNIRVSELADNGGITTASVNLIHEEVTWEFADVDSRKRLAQDGAVPEKYVAEISNLFGSEEETND